jgi:RNA polymerase sigma factor (TIGR02999 family)
MPLLVDMVYAELHKIAKARMRREQAGHLLTPTALVNEAYIRLAASDELHFEGRYHFFAVAARAMRRILVDYARARQCQRRGQAPEFAQLQDFPLVSTQPDQEVLALNEAMKKLAELSPRQCLVVELKHFVGFHDDEIAQLLNVTTRTVNRDWKLARAWLHMEVSK